MASAVVSHRARWVRIVVIALVVLCLAEVGVRARADSLIKPQLWSAPEQTYKSDQITALVAKGGASLIAVGSSTVDAAFNANQLTPGSSKRPAYNAGTGGGSLPIIAGWTEFEAVPRLKPDTVIVGIVSREMNPNDPKQQGFTRDFLALRAFRHLKGTESEMQVVEQRAEDASALFRYRTILRQPRYILNLLGVGDAPRDGSYGSVVNDAGQYVSFLPADFHNTPAIEKQFKGAGLYKWELGRSERALLNHMLAFLHAHVKHVLVVSMPITPVYVEWSPGGQADIDAFNAEVRRQADANGAEFLDVGVWPTDLFADPGHVNQAGSTRFMDTINAEMARLGWN